MQSLFMAMVLLAGVPAPTPSSPLLCDFVYVRDNSGYSICRLPDDYLHRATGFCSWAGPGEPTGISKYAVVGPWADPPEKSPVGCPKFYLLSGDTEIMRRQ